MSRFFIDRPIFAWVIALVIMLVGALSILKLPINQYPSIAPPAVAISVTYPGASAQTVQDTVVQVIEQQLNGIDNLRYVSSESNSDGTMTITATFEQGTNSDTAQVQVQNKLNLATPLLPQEVQQQGIRVTKAVKNFLLVIGLVSEDGSMSKDDLANYIVSNMQDPISRTAGVGHEKLMEARNQFLGMAAQSKILSAVRPNGLNDEPQYQLTVDDERASALGVTIADINNTLSIALGASLDYSKIQKDINVAKYEKTIQTAFQEVSDGLAARKTFNEQLQAQRDLVSANQDYYRLAERRYRIGVDSNLTFLDAQRQLFNSQQSLITDRLSQLVSEVNLYKALGGGWYEQTGQAQQQAAAESSKG